MINNLIPYYIDETNGNLIQYNDNIKINIKWRNYFYNSNPNISHKIETTKRLEQTINTNITLRDKYVIMIRKPNNNNDELCVKLNLCQYIIVWASLNITISNIFNVIKYMIKHFPIIFNKFLPIFQ